MELYVQEAGSPDAATIVFLHGGGLSSKQWQPQFERLKDYHLIAPDLPEQGRSADIRPFTLDGAAQRVAAIIRERVPGGRAHVVGLSLGGAVALTLMRLAPECLDRVIVSGSSARLGKVLGWIGIAGGFVYKIMSPKALVDASLKQFGIPERYHDLVRDDLAHTATAEFNKSLMRELMALSLPSAMTCPLLVAVGEKETIPAKQAARSLVTTLSGARGVVAPGLGHVWNLQDPDLFSDMVRAWISGRPLPPGLRPLS